jgi:hypothetical protein
MVALDEQTRARISAHRLAAGAAFLTAVLILITVLGIGYFILSNF